MNIQQYYQKTATISLNASLVSLIPAFFLVLYGVIVVQHGVLIGNSVPFLLYSFISYQYYLLNDKRSKEILVETKSEVEKKLNLLKEEAILIHFMPAPSLRMLLFGKDGQVLGEIKDMKFWSIRWILPYFLDRIFERKYGLYDKSNKLIAVFVLKNHEIEILSMNNEENVTIMKKLKHNRKEISFEYEEKMITTKRSSLFMDYRFYENKMRIGRLQKGWLPLEWGKKFKDPNTPVLSFENIQNQKDKVMIFAILTELFYYSNH